MNHPIERSTRLQGAPLVVARVTWGALLALYLGLFALGLPASYARARILSPEARQGLTNLGLGDSLPALYFVGLDLITMLAFAAIAVIVVWRRSDDWMVMLVSLTLVATAMLYTSPGYETSAFFPLTVLAVAFAEICQVSFVYLFPTGRFVPTWLGWLLLPMIVWRPLVWGLVYLPNYWGSLRTAENYGTLRQDALDTGLMVALFLVGIIAQVYRYRRVSTPIQRQQSKWLLAGVAGAILVASCYVILVNALGLLDRSGLQSLVLRIVGRTARQIGFFFFPLTIGFSILRYRLWDIDVLIRRTLIYGVLTGMLALAYLVIVIALQQVFLPFTGHQESEVAIVISTLVIAALFSPLRRRVQAAIDWRLYRRKYDAAQVLTAFGATVRDEVDLSRLTQELLVVVEETMQPSQLSLWLRESNSKRKNE